MASETVTTGETGVLVPTEDIVSSFFSEKILFVSSEPAAVVLIGVPSVVIVVSVVPEEASVTEFEGEIVSVTGFSLFSEQAVAERIIEASNINDITFFIFLSIPFRLILELSVNS